MLAYWWSKLEWFCVTVLLKGLNQQKVFISRGFIISFISTIFRQ